MALKHIIKPFLWDTQNSHLLFGFLVAGICNIFMPTPWPMFVVLVLASGREVLQRLGWPWKHEKQTFKTMVADISEFLAGASLASIVAGFLRMYL